VKSYSDETGVLVGEIVAMQADEAVLTDGKVDYDKLRPIMFDISSMSYRVIGPVVGKAYHDGLALKK
jgi:flavoredoxin